MPGFHNKSECFQIPKDAIQECDNKISDCVESTYELNNAINQLHFDIFDDISESIDRIITEQEFLQGLFAHQLIIM